MTSEIIGPISPKSLAQYHRNRHKQRAQAIRADAIIGLSVDIDEISGKGSQMFMITAVSTPVHLKEVACVPVEKQDDLLDGELIQQKVRACDVI